MANHEFGIMQKTPIHGERYDEYSPSEYKCITVEDDYIEKILEQLSDIKFYWHSLDVPAKGLAYCDITLIPLESPQLFIAVLDDKKEFGKLKQLLSQAKLESKYVIHFGI